MYLNEPGWEGVRELFLVYILLVTALVLMHRLLGGTIFCEDIERS